MRETKVTVTSHVSAHGTVAIVFSPDKVEEVTLVDGDDSIKPMLNDIKKGNFDVPFPDAGPVRMVRHAVASCSGGTCDLVLIPSDDRSLLAAE